MVFIKREAGGPEPFFNVGVTMGKKTVTKGSVGIEIEVEGAKLPKEEGTPVPWVYHNDGSLRGEDNAEYVLNSPIDFPDVDGALASLWDTFRKKGSRLDESNRTSVHVHLNVQEFYLNRLTALMSLYIIFEEVLTEWCGEHRVGNLFCLRAKDAPAIVSQIRKFIQTNMQTPLREHHHYAGMNANALSKFGSLEFRPLRGVSDPAAISQWVNILERLYNLSAEFKDPRGICEEFSGVGPMPFFDMILGEQAAVVREGISLSEDEIRDSLYQGIRMAQDLCYSRDWSGFKEINLKPDPFGRDPKKVMKRMQDGAGPNIAAAFDALAQADGWTDAEDNEVEDNDLITLQQLAATVAHPQAHAPQFPPTIHVAPAPQWVNAPMAPAPADDWLGED